MKRTLALIFLFMTTFIYGMDETALVKNQFVSKIDEVIFIVKDKTLSKDARNEKIVHAITPMFDFELMAKLSLGKVWKTLNSQKREEFVDLYVKRMKNSYSSKLDSYSDEKVAVKSVKQTKKTRIELDTNLIGSKNDLDILYKFYKTKKPIRGKNDWLIYDVEILGVSILKTDMAQFKEFLKNNTIEDLMTSIKKQI